MLQFVIRFDLILWENSEEIELEHGLHLTSIGRFPLDRVIGVIYSTYDRATRNKIWGISCNVCAPYDALKEYLWSESITKRSHRLNATRMVFWLGLIVIPKKEDTGSTISNVLILIKKKKGVF